MCICVFLEDDITELFTHITWPYWLLKITFLPHIAYILYRKKLSSLEFAVNKGKTWIWLCIMYANSIKLVFQKQHFLYVTSFLYQSMVLYFFQNPVQMAQPGIQGSPWVSKLLFQYFLTWTLNSTQTEVHTTTQTQIGHCFSVPLCNKKYFWTFSLPL